MFILTFQLLFLTGFIYAQQKDELLKEQKKLELALTESKIIPERLRNAGSLATFYFNRQNFQSGDSLIQLMIEWATTSGKKQDMFAAYRFCGSSYANSSNSEKAVSLYLQALNYAIKERMPNEEIVMLSILGRFYSSLRQFDKAHEYYNRVDLNKDGIQDSTRYIYFYRKAYLYSVQGNRLEVFKNQFVAKKYAVASNNPKYIAEVSQVLGGNFAEIKEFEKAITYYQTAKKEFEKIDLVIGVLNDDVLIADAYRGMKNYSMAEKLFEDVIKKAELTSNFNYKYSAVVGIWGIYYDQNELLKAAAVGKKYKLEDYYMRIGDTSSYYNTMAIYATISGKQDSANFYYRKSIDYAYQYSPKVRLAGKLYEYADYLKNYKRYPEALQQMKLSLAIYDSVADIRNFPLVYQNLDSVYTALGDYKNAWQARGNYYLYRDSLDNLSKKDDILKEEIAAEEESMKKAEEAEMKAIERKHDIQYRVIILGGILLLMALLVIGFFHSPTWLIKGLTFVSFIFMFEFIILLLDTKLHHLFHGAPLPILGAKILIACLLVPLHHIVEKKVLHFLQSKKLHRLKTVFKDEPVTKA